VSSKHALTVCDCRPATTNGSAAIINIEIHDDSRYEKRASVRMQKPQPSSLQPEIDLPGIDGRGDNIMKIKEVPQDDIKTFRGYGTKTVYAVDENGQYTRVSTSGWDAEEVVLRDVVNDFEKAAQEAKARAMKGEASPIEYFMNKYFLDVLSL
jgi:hypothetical protein